MSSNSKSASQTAMNKNKDFESFTQVITATSGEKLLIPKDYKWKIQYLTNKFVLRDRYKNQWLVEVTRDGDQWCFHGGWKDLYSENFLEPKNLVQFAYKGNHVFDFTIIASNGCEKKGVGRPKLIIKEEEVEEDHEEDNAAIENLNHRSETEDPTHVAQGSTDVHVAAPLVVAQGSTDAHVIAQGSTDVHVAAPLVVAQGSTDTHVAAPLVVGQGSTDGFVSAQTDPIGIGSSASGACYASLLNAALNKFTELPSNYRIAIGQHLLTGGRMIQEQFLLMNENDKLQYIVEQTKKLKVAKEEIEKDQAENNSAIENLNHRSETEDGDNENEEEPMHVSEESKPLLHSKLNACGASTSKETEASTAVLRTTLRTRSSTNRAVADCYADEIFESGSIPRPRNPYFVSRSRASNRKFQLRIPRDVIDDYQIKIPDEFMLVDEKGKKWKTKAERGKGGQLWCTLNWRSLCSANNIKKDDACICEFIPGDKRKGLSILVRCVRK